MKKHIPLLLFPISIFFSSWMHYLSTDSIVVDNNPMSPEWLNMLCVTLISIATIVYALHLWNSLVNKTREYTLDDLRKYGYIVLGISFFTLPLLSNDIFSLWGYCESFLQGNNIYTDFHAASQTQYAEAINPLYRDLDCKYGPISILLNSIPVFFSENTWFHFWGTKIIYFIFGIAYIETCIRLLGSLKSSLTGLLILNPIWFIQSVGQLHNDIFGLVFVAIGILLLLRNRAILSSTFFAIAILCKLTFIVFLLFPILYHIYKDKKILSNNTVKTASYLFVALAIFGTMAYYPFIDNISDILSPISAMNTERPSSTFADILAYALLIVNSDFATNYTHTIKLCKYIGIALFIFFTYTYYRSFKKKSNPYIYLLLMTVTLFFVYSHRFLPWYLMSIPLLLVTERKDWIQWFIVVMTFSFFQDIAIVADTNTTIGQIIMAVATFLTVCSFFFKLKLRVNY